MHSVAKEISTIDTAAPLLVTILACLAMVGCTDNAISSFLSDGRSSNEPTWKKIDGHYHYRHQGEWFVRGTGPRSETSPPKDQAPGSGAYSKSLETYRTAGMIAAAMGVLIVIARVTLKVPTGGVGTVLIGSGVGITLGVDWLKANQWILNLLIPIALMALAAGWAVEALGITKIKRMGRVIGNAIKGAASWTLSQLRSLGSQVSHSD